jgi:hypothetical protein
LFQGTPVPYTDRAKVLDQPSKLFQAVPVSVTPQLEGCGYVARLGIGELTKEGDQLVVGPEALPMMLLEVVVGSCDYIAVELIVENSLDEIGDEVVVVIIATRRRKLVAGCQNRSVFCQVYHLASFHASSPW